MVANQRLSMSKTTLDDHEYTTRFEHLDGAIKDLSYNIRNVWKGVPPWLAAMVNKDAHATGPREMTAVGRACITRWVFEEILDRYFHPKVEPGLSSLLKIIEKTIRRAGQSAIGGEEQRDDQIVKLTSWRLTTFEGLAESMASAQGTEYRQQLTANLKEKLSASLQMNLTEPPSLVLESGVNNIIDLAVGLACALPLESRDVCVEYYMPGSFINDAYMKIESGIPQLTNPGMSPDYPGGTDPPQGDQHSSHSGDSNSLNENEAERDNNTGANASNNNSNNNTANTNGANNTTPSRGDSLHGQGGNGGGGPQQQLKKEDNRKKSLFGGLVKKPASSENTSSGGLAAISNNRIGLAGSGVGFGSGKERESMEKSDRDRRIRFAAFVGVEVRNKGKDSSNVLVRAPCYSF